MSGPMGCSLSQETEQGETVQRVEEEELERNNPEKNVYMILDTSGFLDPGEGEAASIQSECMGVWLWHSR